MADILKLRNRLREENTKIKNGKYIGIGQDEPDICLWRSELLETGDSESQVSCMIWDKFTTADEKK